MGFLAKRFRRRYRGQPALLNRQHDIGNHHAVCPERYSHAIHAYLEANAKTSTYTDELWLSGNILETSRFSCVDGNGACGLKRHRGYTSPGFLTWIFIPNSCQFPTHPRKPGDIFRTSPGHHRTHHNSRLFPRSFYATTTLFHDGEDLLVVPTYKIEILRTTKYKQTNNTPPGDNDALKRHAPAKPHPGQTISKAGERFKEKKKRIIYQVRVTHHDPVCKSATCAIYPTAIPGYYARPLLAPRTSNYGCKYKNRSVLIQIPKRSLCFRSERYTRSSTRTVHEEARQLASSKSSKT